jgi:hypothetical protein
MDISIKGFVTREVLAILAKRLLGLCFSKGLLTEVKEILDECGIKYEVAEESK